MGENFDDEETQAGLYFRTIAFVGYDNKHEFVRLMNRLDSDHKESVILEIGYRDAANCLAAILDGEAGDESLALYLEIVENMPLHRAARGAKPRITSLLLDKGFSADLRTDVDSVPICLRNALPLNVALDVFRFKIWYFYKIMELEPWKSPIYQIFKFCEMSSQNAITRVIARNTTEIKHEFSKYLKQGKVFEVGALLAIASDLIMSSSSSTIDGENGGIGFKNIMEMRQFLLAEMSRSLGASSTQLKEMKKTLRLLEIVDTVEDRLVQHMPMWDFNAIVSGSKVAVLMEEAASMYGEKVEVEYDHDAVPSAYYQPDPILSSVDETTFFDKTNLPDVVKSTTVYRSGGQNPNCTRKFSTKVHFPSWLKEGSSHDNAPLPLPTTLKGAVTKHVLSKKHASFTGVFAKAVRRLRYL